MIQGQLAPMILALGLASVAANAAGAPVAVRGPDDEEAVRTARWVELQHALFAGRTLEDGSSWIEIQAPERALDAALVPVNLTLKSDRAIKGVYLVIDDNPGPLAGHFTFGPLGDARSLKLRVRINAYTYIHAIAETRDGRLFAAARFVKAAGGCSAPSGADERQAVQDLGHIKLRLPQQFAAGRPEEAQLMIRHPNFNGMQMDQMTHLYTPPMFIRTIDVTYNGIAVVHLDSDISLSADPVISFEFTPPDKGQMTVLVRDTKDQSFGQSFDVPGT